MKLITLFPAFLLLAAPAANAKPIHLMCNETKVLEDTHTIDTMGRVETSQNDLEPRKEIPIYINPSDAKATHYGTAYQLTVSPTEYKLSKRMKTNEDLGGYLGKFSNLNIKAIIINRASLSFEYSNRSLSFTRGMVNQKSESSRKAVGTCTISTAPSNNKI